MSAAPLAPPAASGKRQRLASRLQLRRTLPLLSRLRDWWRTDVPILAYHRVLPWVDGDAERFPFDLGLVSATATQFRAQMQLVRDHYQPIGFADLVRAVDDGASLPSRPIIVSFDDGYTDNCTIALPILRELGLRATFFVASGHVASGLPFAYDWLVYAICSAPECTVELQGMEPLALRGPLARRRQLAGALLDRLKGLPDQRQQQVLDAVAAATGVARDLAHPESRPMDWEQVRQLRDAGMEVGSHGVWHRMLAKLDDRELEAELRDSKATIERELGQPCDAIAYPVGGPDAYDERVETATRIAGYRIACCYESGMAGLAQARTQRFALRRLAIEREFDLDMFAATLALPEVFGYPARPKRA